MSSKRSNSVWWSKKNSLSWAMIWVALFYLFHVTTHDIISYPPLVTMETLWAGLIPPVGRGDALDPPITRRGSCVTRWDTNTCTVLVNRERCHSLGWGLSPLDRETQLLLHINLWYGHIMTILKVITIIILTAILSKIDKNL